MKVNECKLWTALVTPMNEDGSIDFRSFEKILQQQEEASNGILVLGSTGEGLNLTEEEKQEVVKFAVNQDLEVPVMAGIGGFGLEAQKSFIHFCNDEGVDAFLLVTPLYAKPGKEGQYEWFHALMSETSIPCMLYNVPSRTGVKMHPDVPALIDQQFPHLLGVKEASGSVEEFKAFRKAAPGVDFYSGDDGMTPAFAKEGGIGLVSVASNVWPKETHIYLRKCLDGDTDSLSPVWDTATEVLFKAPNPIPVKSIMSRKNMIDGAAVRLPLSLKDIHPDQISALENADKDVQNWYTEHKP